MEDERRDNLPGWGWPIAVVVVLHLGIAVLPVEFSEAHSDTRPSSEIALKTAPEIEPPVDESVETQKPEPEPEPEPEEVVEADEPTRDEPDADVAVDDDPPEEPVEKEDEIEEVADEAVEEPQQDQPIADVDPFDDQFEPDIPDDWEPAAPPKMADEAETEKEPVDWSGYGQGVMRAVESNREYPRMAQRRGWEGRVKVRVVVDHTGSLADQPELVESSRHTVLDDEAVRMVEAAEPFEAFPGHASEDRQEFVIPIEFQLRG